MTVLNTLTFAKYSVPTNSDPVTKRRNKLLEKIDEQILLATDDTYTPPKRVNAFAEVVCYNQKKWRT
jgi:hypothetical protein